MTSHPSLNAPDITADPIQPAETMGPYEQCWCRSGKKYKWCHFRRDRQTKVNIFQIEEKMLAELRSGYCSHPDQANDPCGPTIIKAHTVQKKGGLAAIAEAGHVLTVKPNMKEMVQSDGNPQPRKIGVNNASVFPGFCNKHDTSLFKPIEGTSLPLTKDAAFLFSYRAIAYERFAKEAQLKCMDAQREADRGYPFWKQAAVQINVNAMIDGIRIGARDVDNWKRKFDKGLISGFLDDFHFVIIRFDRILPLVGCAAFHPEYDFQGKLLQQLGRDVEDFDEITLTVTTFQGYTIVVFGWFSGIDGPAKALADSFLQVEDARKADALVRMLFIHTDNLFIQPSWWAALSDPNKRALNGMTMSGTTMRQRSGAEMATDTKAFLSAGVAEIVSG